MVEKNKIKSSIKGKSDHLTTDEACELLGIHKNSLYKYVKMGIVPAIRGTWRWNFSRKELEKIKFTLK